MPINEKGEFIRQAVPPEPSRRRGRRARASTAPLLSSEGVLTAAAGLLALVSMAALIWFVLAFRQWLVIGAVLWLISRLRKVMD